MWRPDQHFALNSDPVVSSGLLFSNEQQFRSIVGSKMTCLQVGLRILKMEAGAF